MRNIHACSPCLLPLLPLVVVVLLLLLSTGAADSHTASQPRLSYVSARWAISSVYAAFCHDLSGLFLRAA